MTSISHVVLVSWKSGKQIHAEEFVRPSVRGFVGTIPGVLAVVEGQVGAGLAGPSVLDPFARWEGGLVFAGFTGCCSRSPGSSSSVATPELGT